MAAVVCCLAVGRVSISIQYDVLVVVRMKSEDVCLFIVDAKNEKCLSVAPAPRASAKDLFLPDRPHFLYASETCEDCQCSALGEYLAHLKQRTQPQAIMQQATMTTCKPSRSLGLTIDCAILLASEIAVTARYSCALDLKHYNNQSACYEDSDSDGSSSLSCADLHGKCERWASEGECDK